MWRTTSGTGGRFETTGTGDTGTGDGSLSRSVTYFEHLATADFETPVKREICLTDRPASSKRDMISSRCCNASCWNDETLRQPERRRTIDLACSSVIPGFRGLISRRASSFFSTRKASRSSRWPTRSTAVSAA